MTKSDRLLREIMKRHEIYDDGNGQVVQSSEETIDSSGYILEKKTHTISFPEEALRKLVETAVAAGHAESEVFGMYKWERDRSDDYSGDLHVLDGGSARRKVRLTLAVSRGATAFSLAYNRE